MLAGLKVLARKTVLFALVGALVGVLLGAVTDHYLQMIGAMTVVGAGFGMAMGYGFLPEK